MVRLASQKLALQMVLGFLVSISSSGRQSKQTVELLEISKDKRDDEVALLISSLDNL